jgi:hypothetical protein
MPVLHRSQSGVDLRILWVCCDFIFLLIVSVATLYMRNSAADNVDTSFRQSVGGCPSIHSGRVITSRMSFGGFGVRLEPVADNEKSSDSDGVLGLESYARGEAGSSTCLSLPIISRDSLMTVLFRSKIEYAIRYDVFTPIERP